MIRHAIAEERQPDQDDASRALTDEGVARMKQIVRGLRRLDVQIARVLTSPWTRALETAQRVARLTDTRPVVTDLLCQAPRAELLALISEGSEPTAVVGHEPWLSELIAWLLLGDLRRGEAFALKKGGVAELSGSAVPGGMVLRALHPPRALRRLGQR